MPQQLSNNKSVSVNIDKDMFKYFKQLIEKISKRKYGEFINDFLIYANFPDLVKIFEFHGYPNHYEVYNTSKRSTESYKINIKNYSDIDFPEIETPSTYIKKLIIYVVAAEKEFFKLFTFQDIPYNIKDPDEWYDFYSVGKDNGIVNFIKRSQLLTKDIKKFETELKELDNKIYQERLNIFFSDLRFENNLVQGLNGLKLKKYLNENPSKKDIILNTISINKNEYRESYIHDKLKYDLEHFKVNIIILYKHIINNKKPKNLMLLKSLMNEYSRYLETHQDNISFEAFVYFLIFEDRILFRFFVNQEIRFKQKIPHNLYSLCAYSKLENETVKR